MAVADLVRMANQIAANLAHHPAEQAAVELGTHLRMFWAPSMREELASSDALDSLDPVARAGLLLSLEPQQGTGGVVTAPPPASGSQAPP